MTKTITSRVPLLTRHETLGTLSLRMTDWVPKGSHTYMVHSKYYHFFVQDSKMSFSDTDTSSASSQQKIQKCFGHPPDPVDPASLLWYPL